MSKLLFISLFFALAGVISTWSIGYLLAKPNQREIGSPPSDFSAINVAIPNDGKESIAGWYSEGNPQFGGVLLLHSVRSNRLEMVERAKFLNAAGYSVLLIDMQAHGETNGELITFGYLESSDANLAFQYLKRLIDDRPVGIIGVSLGGAAAILGNRPIPADAMVLEAVYSSIEQAVGNRIAIRLGEFGRMLSPLLLWQIEPRLGVSLDKLSPIASISNINAPTMIVSGTEDLHTLPSEAKKMFDLAPEPKILWMVEGASHQNLHRYSKDKYEKNILQFFNRYLKRKAS